MKNKYNIGNYIIQGTITAMPMDTFRGIDIIVNSSNSFKIEDAEPFPLNENWFRDLGFEKQPEYIKKGNGADWQPDYPRTVFSGYKLRIDEDCYFGYVIEKFHWKVKETGNIEITESISIIHGNFYNKYEGSDFVLCEPPEFVHQLQNIYSPLVGKELILKDRK